MSTEILHKLDQLLSLQQKILGMLNLLKAQPPKEEWLDKTDVKMLLKISDRTLYRLRCSGQMPGKKIGGKWYYPHKAVALIINSNEAVST